MSSSASGEALSAVAAGDPDAVLVIVPIVERRRAVDATQGRQEGRQGSVLHSPESRLEEARGLAEAIDLKIAGAMIVTVAQPRPGTLFGSGKVEELGQLAASLGAGLVFIDHAVTPVQQRNLERAWKVKVIDRTGLILEIFGQRARTREGRLQVELAHLTYQKSRLVRAWSHLERQRGGRGFLGGPGEAQIELDRRMLQTRIDALTKELAHVVRTRSLHRAGRRRTPYPIVAIVGYTNAGKSTLFNRITGAGVLAKDQVFATLDPTMREVKLGSGRRCILSDTVGFISDLPTMLVAAFRATLEEVVEADVVLHVRDISHAESEAQAEDVKTVLAELGVDITRVDGHILEVWNKIDLLLGEAETTVRHAGSFDERRPVIVSAVSGEGLEALLARIDDVLGGDDDILDLTVPADNGRLLSWLYDNAHVLERHSDESGAVHAKVRIAAEKKGRLLAQLART